MSVCYISPFLTQIIFNEGILKTKSVSSGLFRKKGNGIYVV